MKKNCRICGTEYEPWPAQFKKYDYQCRDCWNQWQREYATKRVNEGRSIPRKNYPKSAKRKAWQKAYRERTKDRAACYATTKKAIKSGTLVRQPCESCGEKSVMAHHDDYTKPLEIRWLCYKCHPRFHSSVKEVRGA